MDNPRSEGFRRAYEAFDVPADEMLTDASLRERFASRVRAELGESDLGTEEAMRTLLRLRKAGCLPRLRR
jgi:hypothetical protein